MEIVEWNITQLYTFVNINRLTKNSNFQMSHSDNVWSVNTLKFSPLGQRVNLGCLLLYMLHLNVVQIVKDL